MLLISSVDLTSNYFEVTGVFPSYLVIGSYFQIRESTGNDGIYKLKTSQVVGTKTRFFPETVIPSAVGDGKLTGGVYVIDFSDATIPGNDPILMAPTTYDVMSTSLTLPARGVVDYGERLIENVVHLLENFAGSTPPEHPTTGQQWFDYSGKVMRTWVDDQWIGGSGLTMSDPQNKDTAVTITADEPTEFAATGATLYPAADVDVGSPIFRVLSSEGDVHLAVNRKDAISTDLRFVSSGGLNEFKGTAYVGAPKALASGSVFGVNGNTDMSGKIIFDVAQSHGLVYKETGSTFATVDGVWRTTSAAAASASFFNSGGQVAVLGATSEFSTPVKMASTLNVTGLGTFVDLTVTGTLTVAKLASDDLTLNHLLVRNAIDIGATGTTLLADVDVGGKRLFNLVAPTAPTDAATKQYVDGLNALAKNTDVSVSAVTDGQILSYDGATKLWKPVSVGAASLTGINDLIKDKAAESVLAAAHIGITPSYNSTTKALKFDVKPQQVTMSGDVEATTSINWSGTVDVPVTLKASGVTAGTFTKVQVNAKGIVVAASQLTAADIPQLDMSKLTGTLDMTNKYKVINAIDPVDPGDYVTLRFLQNYSFDAGTF